MGIKNLGEPTPGQLIFLDTPGIHKAKTPLGKALVETATGTIGDVDVLLLVVEAGEALRSDDRFVIESLTGSPAPVILVINKIDTVGKSLILPLIDSVKEIYPFREIIPLSALKNAGIDHLSEEIWKLLPEGPQYFPEEMMTDRSERFIAAEIIRKKITLCLHQEIPYVAAVTVDSFKEDETKNLIHIKATINVEKDSQKGIIIGKKGTMLKELGTRARLEMERFFASRIFLELFVRVSRDWTSDPRMLREFGYMDNK